MKTSTVCELYKLGLKHGYTWSSYLQNNITKDFEIKQLHDKVFYDIHYLNHDIIVYYGYYGSLNKLSFKNKTEARRYIQMQLNYVLIDVNFFTVYKEIMNNYPDRWKLVTNDLEKKVIERKNLLESALLSPNISYRAFPSFKKR
tara:strand:+ start:4171 stop:4602 length:432 start_codon:yes stop_codon:yes gene_type:complete